MPNSVSDAASGRVTVPAQAVDATLPNQLI
jgi:hypothetical protein